MTASAAGMVPYHETRGTIEHAGSDTTYMVADSVSCDSSIGATRTEGGTLSTSISNDSMRCDSIASDSMRGTTPESEAVGRSSEARQYKIFGEKETPLLTSPQFLRRIRSTISAHSPGGHT